MATVQHVVEGDVEFDALGHGAVACLSFHLQLMDVAYREHVAVVVKAFPSGCVYLVVIVVS